MLELAIDRDSESPLYRQVYEAVREGILSGRLRAGLRLPATRDLARDLGVSRNTITAAFDQLVVEGYLRSRVGQGTDVVDGLAGAPPRRRAAARPPVGRASRRATALVGAANALPRALSPRFTFSLGAPALDYFPAQTWARLVAARARMLPAASALEPDPAGLPALREAIATLYAAARGIRCDPAQVVIVRGTQHALDLLIRTLLDPGDSAAVEDPGFPGCRGALQASDVRIHDVPVDGEGLRVDVLAGIDPPPRLVIVTPAHQFPLGVPLSLPRRLALLDWARRTGGWILEDDYDSEFRFGGSPLAALRALDERVIYLGTFSKMLLPVLRLGFVIVPPDLVAPLLAMRVQTDLCPPFLDQAALADFITGGHLARHLRRTRRVVRDRRACLLEESRHLEKWMALQEEATGLHLVGWLADGLRDRQASLAAARHGIDVLPLSHFSRQAEVAPALLLGFGAAREPDIRAAVRKLRRALAQM